ncbi:MAG: hypothetical protein A2161_18350 [Candidatus Schekmanbacteria bacterium RBG_13_48_7]|uniref:Uncharacterized protein n=1 Tax=Candidatus Schekmanbacteria bacterium RBG_13_48_7 TaxID=1817878 RepID=A0A1F7RYU4_9BACT|nr:MAG: hypothetical protein A2161_18350 [Candidatus Schekmanbacteria bacterium RBG_13_48_7]
MQVKEPGKMITAIQSNKAVGIEVFQSLPVPRAQSRNKEIKNCNSFESDQTKVQLDEKVLKQVERIKSSILNFMRRNDIRLEVHVDLAEKTVITKVINKNSNNVIREVRRKLLNQDGELRRISQ